jgi:glycosyltransferase involved in cell wall biosynthesis
MKIVHIITGLNQGGAEGALLRLVLGTKDPSKHHIVSLMDEGVHGVSLRGVGCSVHCLGMKKGHFSFRSLFYLRNILKQIKPDLVQTWMYHSDFLGGIAAKSLGLPVIWNIRQSGGSIGDLGLKTWMVAKACALTSNIIPVKIINCSMRSIAIHKHFGYTNNFAYIPNGLVTTPFFFEEDEIEKYRSELIINAQDYVFGHVARFDKVKNHKGFLNAFDILTSKSKNIVAVMAGIGVLEQNKYFFSLCSNSIKSKLRLIGSRTDTVALFKMFDVFVLSSKNEAFPNVVAEAMLQGTPCIVTNVGDAAEIVGDTGWIVPPNNVTALANAMYHVSMLSKQELQQMGARARQRIIDNYSIERMVNEYERIWKMVFLRN